MISGFSESLINIRMSPIVSISEEVRHRSPEFKKKTGKDFILFQRGEIDFPTPKYIREAAQKALDDGFTKYPRSGGEQKLKEAIALKVRDFNKAENINPENIIVTYGGQEALELSFKLFEGEKAAGFAPTWSCVLENFVPFARTDFKQVPLKKDFSIDYDEIEKAIKGVRFFYLNTPQNPTGKLFSEEEVIKIVDICYRNDVFVISDEAYEKIVFDGKKHFSPISLKYDNIISTFTFSKSYSMTGWRLGYLVTRNKRIPELMKLGDYTQTAGVTTFIQYAGAEALNNKTEEEKAVNEMLAEFVKRRDALYKGLKSIDGVTLPEKPQGAFYIFPDFSQFIPSDLNKEERKLYVFNKLLDAGVATVYGSCFGDHFTENLRFSFSATPVEQIKEGIERIKSVL